MDLVRIIQQMRIFNQLTNQIMPKEKEEMIKNSSAQVSIEFTSNDIKVKPEPHTQIVTIQDEQNQNKTQL